MYALPGFLPMTSGYLKQFSPLKKLPLNYRSVGISFRRNATQILKSWSNAPSSLFRGVEQAEKATVIKESVLWGCPVLNFTRGGLKANLPFNGMRQFFVPLKPEKRYPRPFLQYFQTAKLLLLFY